MVEVSVVVGVVLAFVAGAGLAGAWASRALTRANRKLSTLSTSLEAARRDSATRERMFGAVVDAAPMAILLLDRVGTMIFTNPAARELFFGGRDAAGENLLSMLDAAPAPFRDALLGSEDALFSVDAEGEFETYHLAKRTLDPGDDARTLVLVRPLTRELRRQEVAVWKKLLRVISHELNNSLAPISSMADSARRIAQHPEKLHQLDRVFATIEERATHLQEFLEGYARLARLPSPRRAHVAWSEIFESVHEAHPVVSVHAVPRGTGYFDRAQMGQVLENLVKNAKESSAATPEITLGLERAEGGWTIVVSDRGPGMSDEVLASALLPFYSTKERGTGLGLALCREIVEAHAGKIRLQNRQGGGLEVAVFVPDSEHTTSPTTRLTITRV
ncbi:Sensor histidine kinase [Labilithrix luteola]|uniref:histidine kinase n=1 Tax=Labilithrix luteola TaxID=1391654 RepID=A0A0K1PPJ6_9BACT|nr:ATP-binding protein [Labilithrix luteola]AKU95044.1 Sensor histidine kinase [Labilithrix luteola]